MGDPAAGAIIVTLTPNPALDLTVETETVAPNRKLRCGPPRVDPGGGGLNVSRPLRRLGGRTCAVFVAGGPTGARLVAALAKEGIETEEVDIAEETRESISVLETATGDLYRFVLPGQTLSAAEVAMLLDRFSARLSPGAIAVGSGSLPGGVASDFWGRAAQRAKRAGARFVLDSATGVAPALAAGVDVLRFNHDELLAYAGRDLDWPTGRAHVCADLVAAGRARRVIVTHGSDGAILADAEGLIRARPPAVEAQSAVGAGDSFMAGLTFALGRGLPASEQLRLAVACAAAALITPGTELARRSDIDRLLALAPPAERLAPVP